MRLQGDFIRLLCKVGFADLLVCNTLKMRQSLDEWMYGLCLR